MATYDVTINICQIMRHMLNPRCLSEMSSYDVASII
jgi:hypothetical protein